MFLDNILFLVDSVQFLKFISHSVLSNSAFAQFCYIIKQKQQNLSKLFKKHSFYMQATPDDGL